VPGHSGNAGSFRPGEVRARAAGTRGTVRNQDRVVQLPPFVVEEASAPARLRIDFVTT